MMYKRLLKKIWELKKGVSRLVLVADLFFLSLKPVEQHIKEYEAYQEQHWKADCKPQQIDEPCEA